MRGIFLFTTVILISNLSFAQKFGISFGITTNTFIPVDAYFVTPNGIGFKFNLGLPGSPGTKGEDYSNTINWDQFSEDHRMESSYVTTIDFGAGKVFKNFYFFGLLGVATETRFRNCFDKFHILGDNGYYFKTGDGTNHLNFGAETGYLFRYLSAGIHYSRYTGIGVKIGIHIGD